MKKYFPNESPLGQRFGHSVENNSQIEIVGVLRDAKYNSVRDAAPPTMYVPYLQNRPLSSTIVVRTAGEPTAVTGAVREAVKQIDPNLPIVNISTQLEQVERRFQQEKVFAPAYMLFGSLALLLASVGLFGLMSYNVTRRTNEIGIRMALGAQRQHVLRLVMTESMLLVAIGPRSRSRARCRTSGRDTALWTCAHRCPLDRRRDRCNGPGLRRGRLLASTSRGEGRSDDRPAL